MRVRDKEPYFLAKQFQTEEGNCKIRGEEKARCHKASIELARGILEAKTKHKLPL